MTDFDSIYRDDNAKEYDGIGPDSNCKNIKALLMQRAASNRHFSKVELASIQENFHGLMRYRCRNAKHSLAWLNDAKIELPKITNTLLSKKKPEWFGVSGMFGGFSYGLFDQDGKPVLVTDSWVRIVGGSGRQHEITPASVELTIKSFDV